MFPVLTTRAVREAHPLCPRSIPWVLLTDCEPRAQSNHQQTLAVLASRGGLDPLEMVCVLDDRPYPFKDLRENPRLIEKLTADSVRDLITRVARYLSAKPDSTVELTPGWRWTCGLCKTTHGEEGPDHPPVVQCKFCRTVWTANPVRPAITPPDQPTPAGAAGGTDSVESTPVP